MIGYGWGNVYYIANIPRGNVHYIVNITGEGLLWGMFTIRHRHKNENKQNVRYIYNVFSLGIE